MGFSPGPLPYQQTHPLSPPSLSASRAPRRKPDLLVSSNMPDDKSWEWGPAMIRLRSAERQVEEKKEGTDGLEEIVEEEG